MEEIKLISFDQAIRETDIKNRVLLLGNGFSIAWNSKVFNYTSLKESTEALGEKTKELFQSMKTVDFEEIIKAYEYASEVCKVYEMKNSFLDAANELRVLLIETIAKSHPESPANITPEEYERCISFISNFKCIYTLNYDMLLYWVLMKDKFREDGKSSVLGKIRDGFGYNQEKFLNWDGSHAEIHYLHGALHLFEEEDLIKLNYKNTQRKLKEQFIELIQNEKKLPLFVAEGTKSKKLKRIRNSGYLTRCLNSLQKIGAVKEATSLYIYGASLSDNDLHIVRALGENNCQNFYIGIYGDPKSEVNDKLIKNAFRIKHYRSMTINPAPCNLYFFDSSSVKVWR